MTIDNQQLDDWEHWANLPGVNSVVSTPRLRELIAEVRKGIAYREALEKVEAFDVEIAAVEEDLELTAHKATAMIRKLVRRIVVLEKALALQNHELVKHKIFVEQKEFCKQAEQFLNYQPIESA